MGRVTKNGLLRDVLTWLLSFQWMKDMWRSDPCYADYGVDGSTCSFFIYLSEVENWCPHLPWRAKNPYEEADHNSLVSDFGNLLLGL